MQKPSVTYVLPHPNFFAPGKAGQVVHAEGVLEGLIPVSREVHLLAAPEAPEFLRDEAGAIRFEPAPALGRFWYLRFVRQLARHIDAEQPDVVLMRSQPLFLLLAALLLATPSRRRRRYCVEVNGLGFSFAKQGGGNRLVIALSTLAYKILLRPFGFVQVVNDDLGARLGRGLLAIPSDRLLVVHNGGPRPSYAPASDASDPRELHLFFFGLFNPYNDFPLLIDAVAAARADGVPVVLHLVGHGREGDYLRSRADGRSVHVYDAMTRQEFTALVQRTRGLRAGVLPMRYGNGSGSLSPLKAFEYMALGIPLLYSSNCLQDVLSHDVHGAMYAEGRLTSLVDQIRMLADPLRHARYTAAIRDHYPKHTWERRMADLVTGVLTPGARAS